MVNYRTAMAQLTNKSFCRTPKYREQQGRANRIGAYIYLEKKRFRGQEVEVPRCPIGEFEKAFVSDLRRRGMPFFCHSMVRTPEEQYELYKRGVSNAKGMDSPHPNGMAVDIIHSVFGWEISDRAWEIVGHIGKEVAKRLKIDIRWGGDWDGDGIPVYNDKDERLWDPAHWELARWQTLVEGNGHEKR